MPPSVPLLRAISTSLSAQPFHRPNTEPVHVIQDNSTELQSSDAQLAQKLFDGFNYIFTHLLWMLSHVYGHPTIRQRGRVFSNDAIRHELRKRLQWENQRQSPKGCQRFDACPAYLPNFNTFTSIFVVYLDLANYLGCQCNDHHELYAIRMQFSQSLSSPCDCHGREGSQNEQSREASVHQFV